MDVVLLSSQQYQDLLKRLDQIQQEVSNKQKSPVDTFIDNQEFIQIMNVSKRTAQSWRDEGIISFSQIGSKIYYRMSRCPGSPGQALQTGFQK
jgi:hypothetical protein